MGVPPWVLLTVAAIGLLGSLLGALAAFGGVMLTQRRSDRRDEAAWARERRRENERWAREDAARTFELKREAYISYFETVGRYRDELSRNLPGDNVPSREEYQGLIDDLGVARAKVDIYGSPKIKFFAEGLEKLINDILRGRVRREDDLSARVSKMVALSLLRSNILEATRMDLGIVPLGLTSLERDDARSLFGDDDDDDYWDWDDERDDREGAEVQVHTD